MKSRWGKTAALEKAQADVLGYQHIVANTSDMLGLVDLARCYVLTNPAYAALLGTTPEALQGRKLAEILGTALYSRIEPMLDKAMAGEAQHFELERTLRDGLRRVLDVHYQPYVHQGLVQGVVITSRDITRMRDAEAAMRDSEERLRLALDTSNDGLWDWNLVSGAIFRSQRYFDLTEYASDESTSDFAFFQRIVHPDDWPKVQQVIQAHQMGHTIAVDIDFRLITRTGKVKWMRARGCVVSRNAQGTPLRMVGTLSDINTQVTAQDALRRQTEELTQRNAELERFNRATVGREVDMIALKQQVNALSTALGRAPPYPLAFLPTTGERQAQVSP